MNDPAALALVVKDPLAHEVMMWWAQGGHELPEADRLKHCARICASTEGQVKASLERCQWAGLLTKTGITKLARQFVQQFVADKLGIVPEKKKKPPKREPAADDAP